MNRRQQIANLLYHTLRWLGLTTAFLFEASLVVALVYAFMFWPRLALELTGAAAVLLTLCSCVWVIWDWARDNK